MSDFLFRLRALFQRKSVETELDDELNFHFDRQVEKLVQSGLTRQEAQRRARLEFGGLDQVKEECREVRGVNVIETTIHDIRYSLRQLRRNFGFTVVAVLTLALGIGGVTSVFTIINRTLLHALPFPESSRLMIILGAADPPAGDPLKWWGQANAFKELAVYGSGKMGLTSGAQTEQVRASIVSATLFSTLGVEPRWGRTFSEDEDTVPGEGQVAIVSQRLWTQDFGGAAFEERRSINLDGRSYVVIGVMPEGFNFPGQTDVWLPRAAGLHAGGHTGSETPFPLSPTVMIGRLRVGADASLARAQLRSLLDRLTALYTARTGVHFGDMVGVTPLQEMLVSNFRPALEVIFAAAIFLMLIACANAGNLYLARSAAREKEMAVRLCLGASRARLMRLVAAESILLALAAGGISALIASLVLSTVRAFGPGDIPRLGEARLDLASTAFSFCLAAAIGLTLGVISGLRNASTDLAPALHDGGFTFVGSIRRRVRNILVVSQLTIALVLLAAATVMIQSFIKLTRVDPGFDPGNLIAMIIAERSKSASGPVKKAELKGSNALSRGQPGPEGNEADEAPAPNATRPPDTRIQSYRQALQIVGSAPGVVACGMVNNLPMGGETGGYIWFDIRGKISVGDALYSLVYGDYFRAMGIPFLRGRGFREGDGPDAAKVIIVSRTFARRLLHESDPVGESVTLEGEPIGRKIIGLVGDVKFQSLGEPSQAEFYLPYGQPYRNQITAPRATVVVRTAQEPAATISILRDRMREGGQGLSVLDLRLMSSLIADATAPQAFRSLVIGSFASLGVLLAVLGVYGLVSYATARRTHEFAIRAALGAKRSDILRLVLWQGAAQVLAGIVVGLLGAFWLNRAISSLLFGVSPTDPKVLAFSTGLLFCASMLACLLPARRAAKVDPMVALRYE